MQWICDCGPGWKNGRAMSDTTTSTLAAALWDFDGTLADTEPLWIAAEYELIDQLGGTWSDEHAEQLVGNSLLDSGSYILNAIGRADLSPAWVVEQLLSSVLNHLRRHPRSEEHTSELQSRLHLVCRHLLEKKKQPSFLSTLQPTYPISPICSFLISTSLSLFPSSSLLYLSSHSSPLPTPKSITLA